MLAVAHCWSPCGALRRCRHSQQEATNIVPVLLLMAGHVAHHAGSATCSRTPHGSCHCHCSWKAAWHITLVPSLTAGDHMAHHAGAATARGHVALHAGAAAHSRSPRGILRWCHHSHRMPHGTTRHAVTRGRTPRGSSHHCCHEQQAHFAGAAAHCRSPHGMSHQYRCKRKEAVWCIAPLRAQAVAPVRRSMSPPAMRGGTGFMASCSEQRHQRDVPGVLS